jgi:hypothetical protein
VAVFGDVPYSEAEVERLDRMIEDLNARRLALIVHVGDLGTSAQACTDAWLAARQAQLARIRHPYVVIPGDNEWSDCHARGADPMERLERWRHRFCLSPGDLSALKMERQPGPYCEHLRWRVGDTLFVTLNVPGNNNNARMSEEREQRMHAVLAWLDEAERSEARRLVILMQANPFVARSGYRRLVERLAVMGARRPGHVVLVHGDTHIYKDDEPLPGLRRIEVWGSPFVGWTRLVLDDEIRAESSAGY